VLQSERKVFQILGGTRRRAYPDAGKVYSFVGGQSPTDHNLTFDVVSMDAENPELDFPVVQKNAIVGPNVLLKMRICCRDPVSRSDNAIGCDNQSTSWYEIDRRNRKVSDPDFWSLQILKHANDAPGLPDRFPHIL
jgi:hypothetical protein